MLENVRRLHALGFCIHLLRPNSKAPLENNWSKKKRAAWRDLEKAYKKGMNVGVLLGEASKIGAGYLAVIDIDVKSSDPVHRNEAYGWLEKEIPGLKDDAPSVKSGRGMGSMHVYVLTEKPVKPRRLIQSADKVKVLMPSVKPSQSELRELKKAEIDKGWRLRAAWEISLMGTGQQVVLPPSIHPDSGKAYAWLKTVKDEKSFQLFAADDAFFFDTQSTQKGVEAAPVKLSGKKIFLNLTNLDPRTVAMIEDGDGVEDRSSSLFFACADMVRAGFSDEDILAVLTDRSNFLGSVAYEHAKTTKPEVAARWLQRYTLTKSRNQNDLRNEFEKGVVIEEAVDEKAAVASHVAVEKETPWASLLERTQSKDGPGRVKVTLGNLLLILSNTHPKCFVWNDFSKREFYAANTSWGGVKGEELRDADSLAIKVWFTHSYGIEPNVNLVSEAVATLCRQNSIHPVREYLAGLEWDGVCRIDNWLKNYLGAKGPDEYLRAVSRKFLMAMVARVVCPGIKYDQVLILEGKQGIGKSTVGAILAGADWFTDTLPDLKDKDAKLTLQGKWIIELGELANLRRNEMDTVKGFISSTTDRLRAPYGEKTEDYKRQSVFLGTTNNDDYLKDKTGNRRFWPTRIEGCNFKALREARDQLFAEAYFEWINFGEELYLSGKAKEQAEDLNDQRVSDDLGTMMEGDFVEFLEAQEKLPEHERFDFSSFRLPQLFNGAGMPFEKFRADNNYHLNLAGSILRANGFEKFRSSGSVKWRKIGAKKPVNGHG